jgi:hypothetical protein
MEYIINILRLHLSIDCKKVLRRVKVQEYQLIMERVVKVWVAFKSHSLN